MELHARIEQPQADRHRDQGDRDGGEQLEDERGEEGQLEGGQGGHPITIGHVRDGAGLSLGPPEDLEGGEACHDVEEMAGQSVQRPHAGRGAVAGRQADQAHEDGDERHRHRDEHGRDGIGAGHHADDGHRDDHGQEELGQVAGEIAVERVDSGRDEHAQAPAVLVVQTGRAQRCDVCRRRAPQLGLGGGRGSVGRPFGGPGQDGAPDDHRQQEDERGAQRGEGSVVEEGVVGDGGDEPGLGDDQERGHSADEHGEHDEAPCGSGVAQEPRVERPGPVGRGGGRPSRHLRLCAHRVLSSGSGYEVYPASPRRATVTCAAAPFPAVSVGRAAGKAHSRHRTPRGRQP